MGKFVQNFFNLIKNFTLRKNSNASLFYFALNSNLNFEQFKINIDTKCLVLSQYPGAEIKGLGGLIAQYPKNFEVLCLTNGAKTSDLETAKNKKQQFGEVMKTLRVKGYKIFDIDKKCLKNNYSTFKKIDISEVDYIFIPNIYDDNTDAVYLLKHFKQLLKDKEHKQNLKIIMFESDYSLCAPDYIADISNIAETKRKMLKIYYPEEKFSSLADKIIALNSYRAIKRGADFCEAFMSFDIEEFMKIDLI